MVPIHGLTGFRETLGSGRGDFRNAGAALPVAVVRGRRSRLRTAARHPESAIESAIRRTESRRGRERYVAGASRSAEYRALFLSTGVSE